MVDETRWKSKAGLFLASQALSLFGSSLVQYALMWHVTLKTRSGLMMTVYVLCGFVPAFLMSPFAGVWADRMDRKRLIMLSDGMIAAATLGLALALASGIDALGLIMLTAAVRSLGTAVHGPAVSAFLPLFVPRERLPRVNGLLGTVQSAIMLVSPVLSGALMTIWPLHRVFLVDVVTAALAIALLALFLKVPPHEKAARPQQTSYFADLGLGFGYIRRHAYLVSYFAFIGTLLFLVVPAAFLTPLQTARRFGPEVWRLTALEVVFSAGMLAGGGIYSAWGGFRNRIRTMAAAALGMGLCTIGLGLAPGFWIYLVPMGLFGILMPAYHASAAVQLQEHVEVEYQGRVFGVQTMLMTSVMPLGMMAFGPLAEVVPIEILLLVTGAGMVILGLRVMQSRRLLAAGEPPAPTPEATRIEATDLPSPH